MASVERRWDTDISPGCTCGIGSTNHTASCPARQRQSGALEAAAIQDHRPDPSDSDIGMYTWVSDPWGSCVLRPLRQDGLRSLESAVPRPPDDAGSGDQASGDRWLDGWHGDEESAQENFPVGLVWTLGLTVVATAFFLWALGVTFG